MCLLSNRCSVKINIFTVFDERLWNRCISFLRSDDAVIMSNDSLLLLNDSSIKFTTNAKIYVIDTYAEAYGVTDKAKILGFDSLNHDELINIIVKHGSPVVWK